MITWVVKNSPRPIWIAIIFYYGVSFSFWCSFGNFGNLSNFTFGRNRRGFFLYMCFRINLL